MATETVLLYNCEGPEWAKLRQMLLMLRVRIRIVTPDQYGLKLDVVVSGKTDGLAPAPVDEEFKDQMLVFCNFPDPKLNNILMMMRQAGLPPIPLKAMLTPTNRTWTSQELWGELRMEHAAITEQTK